MKRREEIINKIVELRHSVFDPKTDYKKREQGVVWVHALEWVLADEKHYLDERLREIEAEYGRDDRTDRTRTNAG